MEVMPPGGTNVVDHLFRRPKHPCRLLDGQFIKESFGESKANLFQDGQV
jgi:hypothetical protein